MARRSGDAHGRQLTVLIDCHTHLNRYGDSEPGTLLERYHALKRQMEVHGVDYALVLTSYITNEDRPNVAQILDVVGDDPYIGIVAGISYLNYRAADLAELRNQLAAGVVKALKLYPGYEPFYVHDKRMHVIYELAGEFGVPVMIHTGDTYDPKGKVKYSHPIEVDEVAVDFRDVTFVICHLGSPWVTDAMELMYKNPNVVADISGLTLGDFEERFEQFMLQQLREVVAFAGDPSKLLYGTDWPICNMGSYKKFTRNLGLSDAENDLVFWRNSARIFKLDFPGLAEAQAAAV